MSTITVAHAQWAYRKGLLGSAMVERMLLQGDSVTVGIAPGKAQALQTDGAAVALTAGEAVRRPITASSMTDDAVGDRFGRRRIALGRDAS